MKVFAAGLQSETNTFAPRPTGMRAFLEGGVARGEAALSGAGPDHAAARLWRDACARDGFDFTPSLFASAVPSGPTVRSVYERFRDEILADLTAADPFDVVLLFLHGAMAATGYESCEADLVGRVRAALPDAIIGVEFDPHCQLRQDLVDLSDVVILMKEYPHDDYLDRARELYDLCVAAKRGKLAPTSALFDCRMVGFYPTTQEPMASLLEKIRAAEREPGVLSVSFGHGFPWGDTPEAGSRVLVVTDGDAALAQAWAERIGRDIYAHREALLPRFPSIECALDEALATPGLVVLADLGDNAGGGAPSDNVTLLRAMLARGVRNAAVGAVWDPMVAEVCAEAGVGASLDLRLGGKCGPASGQPLDVRATVKACKEEHWQGGLGASTVPLGLSAWIEVDGIDVVVVSVRTQVFDPLVFTGLGIDLASREMVAVKSSQHFHSKFAPLASKVLWVSTPGALNMDFANLNYEKKRDLNYFPRVPAPLGPSVEQAV